MSAWAVFLIVAASAATGTTPAVPSSPVVAASHHVLPLRPLGSGLWTAEMAVGPGAPWRVLVDTGSTHTVIAATAAARAGLTVTPGRLLLTPAGLVDVGSTRLPRLALGDHVRHDVPVLVADLSALGRDPRIDGILGMDVLDADTIVLDLVAGRLILGAPGVARRREGTALSADGVDGRLVVEASVDGRPRRLVLDSGAATTLLYDDGTRGARGAAGDVGVATAGGTRRGRATRAEVSVGPVRLGPVPAIRVAAPAAVMPAEGVLAASVFSRIEIDRAGGRVHVVPRRR